MDVVSVLDVHSGDVKGAVQQRLRVLHDDVHGLAVAEVPSNPNFRLPAGSQRSAPRKA